MLVENNPYPQDIRVFQEAVALKSNGYTVSVVSPAKQGQLWHERINGIDVFRYPLIPTVNNFYGYFLEYGWSLIAMFFISISVLARSGFDIIHIANPPDILVLIGLFYKLFGKRLIFDHHDLAPELYGARFEGKANRWVYNILILFERLSCISANHIITVNQSYKSIEIQRDHVNEEKITVVRNGPPDLHGYSDPIDGGQKNRKFTLTYAGVIGYQDGVDHLVRALHHIISKLGRMDFNCVLVGEGDALSYVRSLAKELKLDDFITYAGWVDHTFVTHYLSAADICIAPEPSNPYNDKCTAIKLMEYMAAGKPIVAFDLPEHRITVQNGAAFARPNDDEDFAAQIVDLMDDPVRCRKLGQINRERIEKKLAWSHQVKYLLGVYENI
jgi:glycosyltransferase involved in cell wall biosynthesis